jgi:hypothetical protein
MVRDRGMKVANSSHPVGQSTYEAMIEPGTVS